MTRKKILAIDDVQNIGWLFSKILTEEGYQVLIALSGQEGISTNQKREKT